VVLDDYHVISSVLVHESLGLHLALTSHSDPPLGLARLRACGQLTELRAADLRFTPGRRRRCCSRSRLCGPVRHCRTRSPRR
jgi:LuxR family maltose regulon positive regulatory protein